MNIELKKLQQLISWCEFYKQCNNEEKAGIAQKQIEAQKKKMKDGKAKTIHKGK